MKLETKLMAMFWVVYAILNFLIYLEIFGNVNKYPYLWLLNSILGFCMFIIYGVRLELERWKKK